MKSIRKIGFWLRVMVSLAACILLFKITDWNDFAHKLKLANIYWLLAVYFNINLDRFLMTYKWTMLLKGSEASIKFPSAIQAYYIGSFWAAFLPASIGADVIRIGWCMKQGIGGDKIVSSVFIERLLGTLALGFVALGSLIMAISYHNMNFHAVFMLILLAFFSSIILILVIFNRHAHGIIQNLSRRLPQRLGSLIEKVRLAVLAFREKPKLLLTFLLLSIFEQFFPIVSIIFLSKAFSIDLPILWAIIGVPIVLIVTRTPISVSGLGVTEGFYAFVFSLVGINVSEALIMALTDRVLLMFSTIPGAIWTITGPKPKVSLSLVKENTDLLQQDD